MAHNPFRWSREGMPGDEENARIQRGIDQTMREVLRRDARHSVHDRKPVIPDPAPAAAARGTGWQEPRPLAPPSGIDLIDAMVNSHLGAVKGKRNDPA